ncbi:hypothetical protein MKX01_013447 [Papaver californicum]|nr:hypothetical protein MKX01_013447 [Papaver californicum]
MSFREIAMQAKQHGLIGINLFVFGFRPLTNSTEDIAATQRANDFYVGWYADPLFFGDYPESMKRNVGSRLPSFTPCEAKLVKGSCDFFGVNHYLSLDIKDNPESLEFQQRDFDLDLAALQIADWPSQGKGLVLPDVYHVKPLRLQRVLEYFKQVYGNPLIYISMKMVSQRSLRGTRGTSINDTSRVNYLLGYIGGLLAALRSGSNTKGYFTRSFLDSIEFLNGYGSNFGLYYVDLINDPDLKRYPKHSAHWYSNFLKGRNAKSSIISPTTDEISHFSQQKVWSIKNVIYLMYHGIKKSLDWGIVSNEQYQFQYNTGLIPSFCQFLKPRYICLSIKPKTVSAAKMK